MSRSAAEDEDAVFLEQVESWIETRLAERPHTFGSLVAALPGVDPILVATALRRLSARGDRSGRIAGSLLDEADRAPSTTLVTRERPLPHPLDFYWAHTERSIEVLVAELAAHTRPDSTIAYLGTPNIVRVAAEHLPDRTHVLLDRSVPRTEALSDGAGRVIRLDLLRDELPELDADAAVLDPPWYPDHMCGFLWAAADMLRESGQLWVSFPPAGTRYAVEAETQQVLNAAAEYGLELIERRAGAVRYVSSPFELASHRAARLGGIPLDWRTGELVRLRLARGPTTGRPPAPNDEAVWFPFIIDDIPVYVRERDADADRIDDTLLRSIVPGDVLTTVSRRDPGRAEVDVWTSLNRIWASSNPLVLQAICRALAEHSDPVAAVRADLSRELELQDAERVRATADYLSAIVKREREEHGL
jgi:hypothetical protein